MTTDAYNTRPSDDGTQYFFTSIGPRGEISKTVVFQPRKRFFNLAFGDVSGDEFDDEVVSNNGDMVKVWGTVVQCVFDFVNRHPGSKIAIWPVDKRRERLYNVVFKRHFNLISTHFDVFGVSDKKLVRYDPNQEFDAFFIVHKVILK